MRLCDVAPDGSSQLISRGVLNLTHRDSHEHPTAVPVGERLLVRVELRVLGQAVPAGHRLRLADRLGLLAMGMALARAGRADVAHGG